MRKALLTVITGALVGALVRTAWTWFGTYGLSDSVRVRALGPAALVGTAIGALLGLLVWVPAQRASRVSKGGEALRKALTILALLVGACAPPHVLGIDIATPAQLAARPYHVITVVEVRVTPASGGVEGAVEKLKARAKELGGDAIMDIGEGSKGAVLVGQAFVSARTMRATVIAWDK